jgi:hypothetical protein
MRKKKNGCVRLRTKGCLFNRLVILLFLTGDYKVNLPYGV